MDLQLFVQERVKSYYWDEDLNCATTNLKILSERYNIELSDQVLYSAIGMHGAGKYGAQCGLVEGALMFLGIFGRLIGIPDKKIICSCNEYASKFDEQFSSLLCKVLRPEGFNTNNPQHLCEKLTCKAICFNIEFIDSFANSYDSDRNGS